MPLENGPDKENESSDKENDQIIDDTRKRLAVNLGDAALDKKVEYNNHYPQEDWPIRENEKVKPQKGGNGGGKPPPPDPTRNSFSPSGENSIAEQLELVKSLKEELFNFTTTYKSNIEAYVTKTKVTQTVYNGMHEPFQNYIRILDGVHQRMKLLRENLEQESLPRLTTWQQRLEDLLK